MVSLSFCIFAPMNYTLTTQEASMAADEFVRRYRDVERFDALCTQCPSYGNMWCCPPFGCDPRTFSDGFKTVTMIATTIEFDQAIYDACQGAREKSREVSREAMKEVWSGLLPELLKRERERPGSRAFTFRCSLCPEGCTRPEGKPCPHPDIMRHSLEAVGFDVSAAAHDMLGIVLEWSADGSLTKRITIVTALMIP